MPGVASNPPGYAWHEARSLNFVSNDAIAQKRLAAGAAVELVEDGMVIGIGTGSTAALAVEALGKRVAQGLRILGVPTSEATAAQARQCKIPLTTLNAHPHIDLAIDGADEVEKGTLHLIKGHGGALLREKIVASSSARFIVIVDDSKLVDRLGTRFPIPVEVDRFGWMATAEKLRKLDCAVEMRRNSEGVEFVTDGHNYILDCTFGPIQDAPRLAGELDGIVGVVEHGLFPGMTSQVLIGGDSGVRVLKP